MKENRAKIIVLLLFIIQVGYLNGQEVPTKEFSNKKFELRPNSREQAPVRHSNFKQRMTRATIASGSVNSVTGQKNRPDIKPNKSAIKNQIKMIQKRRQAVVRRNFRR